MRSMPSLCGSCKRGGSYFAFAAARRRFPPGASHANAGAPAGNGPAAPARAAVGDLRLLCHCNAGYCLHHCSAVARAYFFAILGFLMPFAAMVYATLSGNPPFPLAAMVPLAIFGGTILGCYVLLIGYVNRDAGRRGMSRLGWTLLAIFIPNALGIVLYFVL